MTAEQVAIYLRVSTLEQASEDATSLDHQEERCRAYAESQGWTVAEVYREEGFTGTVPLNQRPTGATLLADAESGEFGRVLTYNVSRFSRSIRYFMADTGTLEDLGVYFVSVSEQFDTATAIGRMVRVLLVAFAEFEAEQIRERMTSGKAKRLKAGLWAVGPTSLGYVRNPETRELEVNEDEATLVNRIFDLAASGLSTRKAAEVLNADGIPSPRRKEWSAATLDRIIEKRGYMGEGFNVDYESLGETFNIPAPAIVTPEIWETANAVRESVREGALAMRSGKVNDYALSGRVLHRHGDEARIMNGKTRSSGGGTTKRGWKTRAYRCIDYGDECPGFADDKQLKKSLDAPGVEAWALLVMLDWLNSPENVPQYVEAYDLRSVGADSAKVAAERIERRLGEVQDRRRTLVALVASGDLSEEDARDGLADLKRKEAELGASLERLQEKEDSEAEMIRSLDFIRETLPGEMGPEGKGYWSDLRQTLMEEGKTALETHVDRIGAHGPGKPAVIELSEWAQKWTTALVDIFDFRVHVADFQHPNTWSVTATLSSEPTSNGHKKVVRDEYSDLLMEG